METTHTFFEAVKDGDLPTITQMVERDPALVNARSQSGLSAVLTAIYYGERSIAELGTRDRLRALVGRASSGRRTAADRLPQPVGGAPQPRGALGFLVERRYAAQPGQAPGQARLMILPLTGGQPVHEPARGLVQPPQPQRRLAQALIDLAWPTILISLMQERAEEHQAVLMELRRTWVVTA